MLDASNAGLLDARLDSGDRTNTILVDLLHALEGGLEASAIEGGHTVAELALELSGRPLSDDIAGPVTWGVWMDKTAP